MLLFCISGEAMKEEALSPSPIDRFFPKAERLGRKIMERKNSESSIQREAYTRTWGFKKFYLKVFWATGIYQRSVVFKIQLIGFLLLFMKTLYFFKIKWYHLFDLIFNSVLLCIALLALYFTPIIAFSLSRFRKPNPLRKSILSSLTKEEILGKAWLKGLSVKEYEDGIVIYSSKRLEFLLYKPMVSNEEYQCIRNFLLS